MYTLRKATLDDINKLIEFRIEFLKEFQQTPNEPEMITFQKSLRDFLLEKMKSDEFIAWLAEVNNEIIATSGLSFLQRPPHFHNLTGKFGYIMNMYTKPEWRQKGIASALLEKLIEEIRSKGIDFIFLHATPIGKPLYLKYGFTEDVGDKEMVLKLKEK
ncbi:MAG: GNAT family N-acetyltransferase [Asgard group archaeon]|nr:GNAT family N-acetyltransferase [Asgard group archaeon]